MAWTNVHSIGYYFGSANSVGSVVEFNGTDTIYYYKDAGSGKRHLYAYNKDTDSETQLSDDSSFPNVTTAHPIIYLSSNIHAFVRDGDNFKCYHHSTGTTWTSTTIDSATSISVGIVSAIRNGGTCYFAHANDVDGAAIINIFSSTNMTSWSSVTVDAATNLTFTPHPTLGFEILIGHNAPGKQAIFEHKIDNNFTAVHRRLLGWNGSKFEEYNWYDYDGSTATGETDLVNYYMTGENKHWRINGSNDEHREGDLDTWTWTAPADASIEPMRGFGYDEDVGFEWDGIPDELYFHTVADGVDDWSSADTVLGSVTTSTRIQAAFKFSDGDEILFVTNSSSSWARLYYQASSSSGNKKFYYGTNGLTDRYDMPFIVATPDGLAVRSDKTAVIGASTVGGGGEMVEKGSSSDNYAAWTGITDSHGTSRSVKSLKWVNGGVPE